jgi:divalent metal cation (Fe/Co/Zn/Cd) transporter
MGGNRTIPPHVTDFTTEQVENLLHRQYTPLYQKKKGQRKIQMNPTDPQRQSTQRRILRIQTFTLVWMSAEAAVSLAAAWTARSPALLAFGGDSAIELVSGAVVFWRFRPHLEEGRTEQAAARIAGGLLFALAAYVVLVSGAALLGHGEVRRSLAGIAVLLAAAIVMPWLARQKRLLSVAASSAALRADASESAVCGYLAWIALAGLSLNALWGIRWADPLAALGLIPFILREAWEAVGGA